MRGSIIINLMKPLACGSLCISSVLNKAQQLARYYRRESWSTLCSGVIQLFPPSTPLSPPAKLPARFCCKRFTSLRKSYDVCKFHLPISTDFSLQLLSLSLSLSISLFSYTPSISFLYAQHVFVRTHKVPRAPPLLFHRFPSSFHPTSLNGRQQQK